MKNKYWIDLHYALRLDKTITVKTLKTIVNVITTYIVYVLTTCLIVASLSSCSTIEKKQHKVHIHNKIWDSYKTCSAYGNP